MKSQRLQVQSCNYTGTHLKSFQIRTLPYGFVDFDGGSLLMWIILCRWGSGAGAVCQGHLCPVHPGTQILLTESVRIRRLFNGAGGARVGTGHVDITLVVLLLRGLPLCGPCGSSTRSPCARNTNPFAQSDARLLWATCRGQGSVCQSALLERPGRLPGPPCSCTCMIPNHQ